MWRAMAPPAATSGMRLGAHPPFRPTCAVLSYASQEIGNRVPGNARLYAAPRGENKSSKTACICGYLGKFTTRAGIRLGRHRDRMADSGTGGRADGRLERGDGTTGGVALPLLAAALVCLLATSGVWLFSNTGEDEKRNDTTIGLNVPTGGVNVPPNMGSENMTGPQASGTAAPSKSATGPKAGSQSPSKVGVKSPSAK